MMHVYKVVKQYEDEMAKKLNQIHMAASVMEFNIKKYEKATNDEDKEFFIKAVLADCQFIKNELTHYRNYTLESLKRT